MNRFRLKRNVEPGAPRQTSIIGTIGPACRSVSTLLELVRAGLDIVRLHFSYEDQRTHAEHLKRVRLVSEQLGRPLLVLQDLSGSKARLMNLPPRGVVLKAGDKFALAARSIHGSLHRVSLNFPSLLRVIRTGDRVLLNDGALEMEVISKRR